MHKTKFNICAILSDLAVVKLIQLQYNVSNEPDVFWQREGRDAMINKSIQFRIPEELKNMLQAKADKLGITLSAYIKMVLTKAVYKGR